MKLPSDIHALAVQRAKLGALVGIGLAFTINAEIGWVVFDLFDPACQPNDFLHVCCIVDYRHGTVRFMTPEAAREDALHQVGLVIEEVLL